MNTTMDPLFSDCLGMFHLKGPKYVVVKDYNKTIKNISVAIADIFEI
jgi:hypothetical protein